MIDITDFTYENEEKGDNVLHKASLDLRVGVIVPKVYTENELFPTDWERKVHGNMWEAIYGDVAKDMIELFQKVQVMYTVEQERKPSSKVQSAAFRRLLLDLDDLRHKYGALPQQAEESEVG